MPNLGLAAVMVVMDQRLVMESLTQEAVAAEVEKLETVELVALGVEVTVIETELELMEFPAEEAEVEVEDIPEPFTPVVMVGLGL